MKTTADILENHLTSFGEGNIERLLSDYAPSAVLFTPDGLFVGPDAIRPLFEQLIDEFSKPGASFEMKTQYIEGEYAFIVWAAETVDNVYELATDTFVIRKGKIAAQSFAAKVLPKGVK